ncbi:MAG: hypothetical protein N3A58_06560 [Spirochaetes bacterium]|nr:hypothetical protein [Spirochaetota bacterium]
MKKVKAITYKTFILLILLVLIFLFFSYKMGLANFISTIMKTAHDLLLNTCFFIMALSVISGAFGSFLVEFGIISLLNKILAPVIKVFWGLPGAAAIGALSTYISDNPAIIALAKDKNFMSYFEDYQKPALTNFGTSFGMGLIITAYMFSKGFFIEALIGNVGTVIGSIFSTRMMINYSKKYFATHKDFKHLNLHEKDKEDLLNYRYIREGNYFQRLLDSILDGGKNGLEMGFQIIPGVLIICTFVLLVTFDSGGHYNGSAYQGVPILPFIGSLIFKPLKFLFGFSSPESIAFPVTSLGAVGAALGLIPKFLQAGLIKANDIAVFTAIGMTWSGYLSTHVGMMDALGYRDLTSKAIISHTIGGLIAGISANYIYFLFFKIF